MDIIKKQMRIGGMSCVNCQNRIEKELNDTKGVLQIKVSYGTGIADIVYDGDAITQDKIFDVIKKTGYEVLDENSGQKQDVVRNIALLIIIAVLYIILQQSGILNLLVPGKLADTKMGYGMLFVIGLITSVHCIAMCGGINLTQCIPKNNVNDIVDNNVDNSITDNSINNVKSESRFSYLKPAVLYNLGRVISYTAIGFILGLVGMFIVGNSGTGISVLFQGILKIIAGIFMVIMGINMLDIFPALRRFSLRVPRFIGVKINKKKSDSKQPIVIGTLNGLMPCGPLQSMQIVAFGSGNPVAGAFAMFMFSLGTVPLMLGFGAAVSALGKRFSKKVMGVGAVLVVVMGLAMLSQGGSLSGLTSNIFVNTKNNNTADEKAELTDGVQIVKSTLQSGSYPNITVSAGIPVKWVIDVPKGSINGCNYKMVLSEYGIEHTFTEGENIIEFTPEKTGTVSYTCWMGMIHGSIYVEQND
ncbi:sulfite exporter TauE/SafE family protein [Eubacterium sp. MSJ-13]|uniref:urease accessory protein UreH domain-containing protein n=1 Tax=Eubacterium sp. MSJ-13 TaxID=2841513 RepID=UPI001C10A603|nr:sulfite exporter TauE/SafE family protein [Eubacterium sp. MSJ-13]MBU5478902.1 sulfite exporter TauE/SafE family protein [Eubacterium sp. MSJ-13]